MSSPIYYAEVIYPAKDKQYKLIRQAICNSQLINTWAVPPTIIGIICGFSLGNFVECSSVDCSEEIHIFNEWQYKNHVDGLRLGYLKYKENCICTKCYYERKYMFCTRQNSRFINEGDLEFWQTYEGYEIQGLCEEFVRKEYGRVKYCASGCAKTYFKCSNNCVEKLLEKCGVCEEIICADCAVDESSSICAYCSCTICSSCIFGDISNDINKTICQNCNNDLTDQIMTDT